MRIPLRLEPVTGQAEMLQIHNGCSGPYGDSAMSRIGAVISPLTTIMILLACSPCAMTQDSPIKRTELHRSDLADVVGKEAVIYIADLMPGAVGGRHTHYGDEYVYVLEGSLIVTPDGQAPILL